MDKVDLGILRELQRDGTLSTAALAERVGASQASCWRRVRALEDAGVLGAAVRPVNAEAMGLAINVICHVRMKDHTPESSEVFRAHAIGLPEVMACYSMSGEWDYLLQIVSRDVRSYEAFLMTQLLSHPTVGTASSHFVLSTVKLTTAIPI